MRVSRETWIGIGALAVATAAMAVDHLFGNEPDGDDDSFPVDPAAFFISVGICALVAVVLFARVVPRAKERGPESERTPVHAALLSGLSVVPGFGFLWLGFPVVLAGAGVALGLLGRRSARGRLAVAAVVVGAGVILLVAAAYVVELIRSR